jgi:hypothetical protein
MQSSILMPTVLPKDPSVESPVVRSTSFQRETMSQVDFLGKAIELIKKATDEGSLS